MSDDVLRVVVGVIVFGGISRWIFRRTKDPSPNPLNGYVWVFGSLLFWGMAGGAFFRMVCGLVLGTDPGTEATLAAAWLFMVGTWVGLRYPNWFLPERLDDD